ncbi:hypothetical protein RRG08_065193 [Elysia crispata]|uniref:Uncharacterized protein n=1 Tax=Elysia crispata TaxID=231223 RepID=A0AAE0Z424_9GAST|nr:hypothetical protein RRG08_065193 [Elysia crispata]
MLAGFLGETKFKTRRDGTSYHLGKLTSTRSLRAFNSESGLTVEIKEGGIRTKRSSSLTSLSLVYQLATTGLRTRAIRVTTTISHETKLYRMNLLDNPTTLKLVHNLACGEGPSRLGHLQIDSERRAGFTRGQITIMQVSIFTQPHRGSSKECLNLLPHSQNRERRYGYPKSKTLTSETLWLSNASNTGFRDIMVIQRVKHWLQRRYGYPKSKTLTLETLWLSIESNTGFRNVMVIQCVKHWLQRRYGYPKSQTLTSETLWLSKESNTDFRDIMVIQRVKH